MTSLRTQFRKLLDAGARAPDEAARDLASLWDRIDRRRWRAWIVLASASVGAAALVAATVLVPRRPAPAARPERHVAAGEDRAPLDLYLSLTGEPPDQAMRISISVKGRR